MTSSSQATALSRNDIPLHVQLRTLLRNRIMSGDLPERSLLPTEFELSERYGVSRTVVRQAMSPLAVEGLVIRVPGKGTYVGSPVNRPVGWSIGSIGDLLAFGRSTHLEIIDRKEVPADGDVAESLSVASGTAVFRLRGLRHSEGRVISYQRNFILLDIGRKIANAKFADGLVFTAIEGRTGLRLNEIVQTISAVAADKESSGRLKTKLGSPLLQTERIQYCRERGPVAYSITHYLPEHYSHTLKLRRVDDPRSPDSEIFNHHENRRR